MVDPSEGVGKLQLLVVLEPRAKEGGEGGENDDISGRDTIADEEHALGHVGVDVVSELSAVQTADHLNKLADLNANLGVSLREEDILKVTSAGDFKHDRERVCKSGLLVHDSVVGLWLGHGFDQKGNLLDLKDGKSFLAKAGELHEVTLACTHVNRVKFKRKRKSVRSLRIADEELHSSWV